MISGCCPRAPLALAWSCLILNSIVLGNRSWAGFFETFESSTVGAFPEGWNSSGNSGAVVDDTYSSSGQNSIRVYGSLGSCWGGLIHHSLTQAAPFLIEVDVRNGPENLHGCHPNFAKIALHTGPSWSYQGRGLLQCNPAGGQNEVVAIGGSGTTIGNYSPEIWSRIAISYEPTEGGTVRVGYWIDGLLADSFEHTAYSYEGQLGYLTLESGEGTTWFDNIRVSPWTGRYGVEPQDVDLDVPRSGVVSKAGEVWLYRLHAPAGGYLDLDLQGPTGSKLEIYARFGEIATFGNYDLRSTISSSSENPIVIPTTQAGEWYVLVYASFVESPGDWTFTGRHSTEPLVASVFPSESSNSGGTTINVSGAGFDSSAQVSLVQGDNSFAATDVIFVASDRLVADFDLTSLVAGEYQLTVEQGDQSLSLPFTVTQGIGAKLETRVIVPERVGYHALATVWVEYENSGDAPMPAPLLELTAAQNGAPGAWLTLTEHRLAEGFWTSATPQGFAHSVQFLASGKTPGLLQPGESRRIPVYYAGWKRALWDFDYPPIYFNLGVIKADNPEYVDWEAIRGSMRPDSLTPAQWDPVFWNLVAQTGVTWGDYVRMLNDNAIYLDRLGIQVNDIRELLGFEVLQASGIGLTSVIASAVDAQAQAPGVPLAFSRSFSTDISSHFRAGRFGYGWTDNWDYALQKSSDGTVTILGPGGTRRVFQPDSRKSGKYFTPSGEASTLISGAGGSVTLRESDGMVYAFRADGKLDYLADTHDNRVSCIYDGDHLVRLLHSAGPYLDLSYSGDRVVSISDSAGRQTDFSYHPIRDLLASVTDFRDLTTEYTYETSEANPAAKNAVTAITNPDGSESFYAYDGLGRLVSKSGCCGSPEVTTYSYGSAGRVTSTDALDHATHSFFDHRGRLVRTEDPLGNVVHRTFDINGRLIKTTDAAGRSRTFTYDSRGNLTSETNELGYITRFAYTSDLNRLSTLVDANGNVTQYAYEVDGDLTSITYADGSVERWTYDDQGNRISWTNRRGQTIDYINDVLGRLVERHYPDEVVHTFGYDAAGNMTGYSDPLGDTVQEYDDAGRLIKITYPGERSLAYTYDAAGRRTSMVNELGNTTNYHYDVRGRLWRLSDENDEEIVEYHYDEVGRLTLKTLGNGVYTTYSYDAAGHLLDLFNHKPDGAVLSRFEYTYDRRGRRVTMTTTYGVDDPREDLAGTWNYQYDDSGQLIGWEAPWGRVVEYTYDPLGNRLNVRDDGVDTKYVVNNLNQYVKVGETAYAYDLDGNFVAFEAPNGSILLDWSVDGRCKSVDFENGSIEIVCSAIGDVSSIRGINYEFLTIHDPISKKISTIYFGNDHYSLVFGYNLVSAKRISEEQDYFTLNNVSSISEVVNDSVFVRNCYTYEFDSVSSYCGDDEMFSSLFSLMGGKGAFEISPRLNEYNLNDSMLLQDFSAQSVGTISSFSIYIPGTGEIPIIGVPPIIGIPPIETFPDPDPRNRDPHGNDCNPLDEPPTCSYDEVPVWNAVTCSWECLGTNSGYCSEPDDEWRENCNGELECRKKWEPRDECDMPEFPLPDPPDFCDLYPQYCMCYEMAPMCYPSQPVKPTDPNELIGPSGFGPQHHVAGDATLPYEIHFENESDATAPAQRVEITDPLPGTLNGSTFELTEIAFGDHFIAVPPETQHYETTVSLTEGEYAYEVQIEAGIRLNTREVYATFQSIDPTFGLPPPVDIGFLPPEDGTGRGQGHIGYVIRPQSDLTTGTEIRNIAQIVFDGQPAIATNQVDPHDPSKGTDPEKEALVTIDAGSPTSAISVLPDESDSESVMVSWNGQDDAGGSGVASYDVYVSEDDGDFLLWLEGTVAESVSFSGGSGHRYAFYSRAWDNVGLVEPAKTTGEGMIAIDAHAGYFDWRRQHFTEAELNNPALEISLWGDAADSDQDGIGNLLEYVLGLDPEAKNEFEILQLETLDPVMDGEVLISYTLQITYRRVSGGLVAIEAIYRSGDLENWSPLGSILSETSTPDTEDVGYEQVVVRININEPSTILLLLQAELIPKKD